MNFIKVFSAAVLAGGCLLGASLPKTVVVKAARVMRLARAREHVYTSAGGALLSCAVPRGAVVSRVTLAGVARPWKRSGDMVIVDGPFKGNDKVSVWF